MSDSASAVIQEPSQRMQCMEVWGGNVRVEQAFELPGLRAWIYSRPYCDADSGGDVYYLSSCASGRITRLLLADVSGHGPEVSELAVGLRDLMRRNVNVVKQTRFLEGMNRQFQSLSECGAFATALVATYFQPTRRLTLCNAGHPAPLRYDAAASSWTSIKPPAPRRDVVSGTPLGVFDDARYPQVEQTMAAGDMVLLFSDALVESRNSAGQMLGEQGLLQIVRSLSISSPADLMEDLVQQIDADHPESRCADDLTMLLVQATSTSTRWSDNLLALLRLFRPVKDRTNLVT